jgi:heterodisulfide reductase subunit C
MSKIKTNRITEINNNILDEVTQDGCEEIMACMQCGMCTGGCPSGRRSAIKTRSIIRKVQYLQPM